MCSAPAKKKDPRARSHATPERRLMKYVAATHNIALATTHHKAGRHAYTPATMPREYSPAGHNIGWRDALNWKAGRPAAVGDEIIGKAQEGAADPRQNLAGLPRQVNDSLEVIRLREQIDQMNLLDPISTGQ
jgi:hypothetical protein